MDNLNSQEGEFSSQLETIKSLSETKKEIFKIIADKETDQELRATMLQHLVEIDKGLIKKIESNSNTIFEIKTHNEVIELKAMLKSISKNIDKLLKTKKQNLDT